ncbi:hypothetical protein B4N89_27325 [Embleya scabrispora]|uniref:PD-(D/E)XK endonuclease-like domain-containing protein n=1 Tax=Embleya scabrispora TaxID=159449 RepID=A0A1T3P505_9ACTN|nr:hypothetical protein [Embleya scabrispora]OPC84143.1 hypothetical protein B4N89_27325 [Embleya scabrispora]
MTDPFWARHTDHGRYYLDPATGELLPSVTNVIGTCVAKERLVPWAAKITAEWAADHPDEIRDHVGADRAALIRAMTGAHVAITEHAMDLGTRVHAGAEAKVLGAPVPDDSEAAPYLCQLDKWLTAWRVDPDRDIEAAELTVINRTVGFAGTGDLLVWLRTGRLRRRQLWLIDYKSSATRPASSVYPEYDLQLGALRNGETVLLPDGTELPMPRVQRAGILNLRARSHAFVPMPANDATWNAFRNLVPVARWLHDAPTTHPALKPPPWADEPTTGEAA